MTLSVEMIAESMQPFAPVSMRCCMTNSILSAR